MFLMELLQHKISGAVTWMVSPKNTKPQENTRIICNKFILDNYATQGFIPLSDGEKIAFNYLKNDKICYSDNLTGTEFKQCYNMLR